MSRPGLLKKATEALQRLGIPYMLTGSLASSLQGEPRATHDVDLVVDLSQENIDGILVEFPPPDFYLSRAAIEQAVREHGMFNVVELNQGDKVDFWMLTGDAFDRSRFARRQRIEIEGFPVFVSMPEDTILMKLKWAQDAGGSTRQFRDALRVYEVQHKVLDRAYLVHWVNRLGLASAWEQLLRESEPIN